MGALWKMNPAIDSAFQTSRVGCLGSDPPQVAPEEPPAALSRGGEAAIFRCRRRTDLAIKGISLPGSVRKAVTLGFKAYPLASVML